jgi:hypothetical protein
MRLLVYYFALLIIGASAVFHGCSKEKANGPNASMKVVNLGNHLLSIGYTGELDYPIDLDGNSKPDFTFSLWGQVNGYGSWRGITLKSADSAYFPSEFVRDVNGIDTSNVKIVRIFNQADTIYSQDCLEQVLTMTHYSDGKNPPKVYLSVDNWLNGVHYIGFKKPVNGIVQLGWIKVEVLAYTEIRIKEYAISRWTSNVNDLVIESGR